MGVRTVETRFTHILDKLGFQPQEQVATGGVGNEPEPPADEK